MGSYQIIKKITSKTVYGGRPKLAKGEKEKEVMKVYGQARTMATGETDFGPFLKFGGSFEAVNSETGETFRSGVAILPDIAADMLAGQLADDGVTAVNFAFSISIKEDDTAATGYVYTCAPLIDAGDSDPLAALKSQLVENKALPAPEKPKAATKEKTATKDKDAA